MRSLLVYNVLLKRKEPLDQFRNGIKTLGILSLLELHPDMMESFFTDLGCEQITSDYLIGKLFCLAIIGSDKLKTAYHFLIDAIKALEKG